MLYEELSQIQTKLTFTEKNVKNKTFRNGTKKLKNGTLNVESMYVLEELE